MKANLKKNLVASTVSSILLGVAGLGVSSGALATNAPNAPCPDVGYATAGCDLIITLNNNGTASISNGPSSTLPASGPPNYLRTGTYDGSDDTLIGVVNNSNGTVNSIFLSSSSNSIFGFDRDGISANPNPTSKLPGLVLPGDSGASHGSGYSGTDSMLGSYDLKGPLNSFSSISSNYMSGDVNFGSGLAAGGSAFFSLEEPLSTASFTATPVSAPEPGSLAIFAAGLAGFAGLGWMRRRRRKS